MTVGTLPKFEHRIAKISAKFGAYNTNHMIGIYLVDIVITVGRVLNVRPGHTVVYHKRKHDKPTD